MANLSIAKSKLVGIYLRNQCAGELTVKIFGRWIVPRNIPIFIENNANIRRGADSKNNANIV
jgi:hypothetical protein